MKIYFLRCICNRSSLSLSFLRARDDGGIIHTVLCFISCITISKVSLSLALFSSRSCRSCYFCLTLNSRLCIVVISRKLIITADFNFSTPPVRILRRLAWLRNATLACLVSSRRGCLVGALESRYPSTKQIARPSLIFLASPSTSPLDVTFFLRYRQRLSCLFLPMR